MSKNLKQPDFSFNFGYAIEYKENEPHVCFHTAWGTITCTPVTVEDYIFPGGRTFEEIPLENFSENTDSIFEKILELWKETKGVALDDSMKLSVFKSMKVHFSYMWRVYTLKYANWVKERFPWVGVIEMQEIENNYGVFFDWHATQSITKTPIEIRRVENERA